MNAEGKRKAKLLPELKATTAKNNCKFIKGLNGLLNEYKKTKQSDCEDNDVSRKRSEDFSSPSLPRRHTPAHVHIPKPSKTCFSHAASVAHIVGANLRRAYVDMQDVRSNKCVDDIVFNRDSHLVAAFKEFLLYDDTTEFCKRAYGSGEVRGRVMELCEFYATYSKIFPNYIILEENTHLYRNIRKKQKAIDRRQEEAGQIDFESSVWSNKKMLDTNSRCNTISLSTFKSMSKENKEDSYLETMMKSYIRDKPLEATVISLNPENTPLSELLEKLSKKERKPIITKQIKRTVVEGSKFWSQVKDRITKYKQLHSKPKGKIVKPNQQNNVIVYNIQLNTRAVGASRNKSKKLWKLGKVQSQLQIHDSSKSIPLLVVNGKKKDYGRSSCGLLPNPSFIKTDSKEGRGPQKNRKVQTETDNGLFRTASALLKSKHPFERLTSTRCLLKEHKVVSSVSKPELRSKVLSINMKQLYNDLRKQNVQLKSEASGSLRALNEQRRARNKYLSMVKEKVATQRLGSAKSAALRSSAKHFLTTKGK